MELMNKETLIEMKIKKEKTLFLLITSAQGEKYFYVWLIFSLISVQFSFIQFTSTVSIHIH